MKIKRFIAYFFLVFLIAGLTWLVLLYRRYGSQTLLFLLRSPAMMLTYSKAMLESDLGSTTSPSPGSLNTDELTRPRPSLPPVPSKHLITTMSHVYQKLNNCGPSSALMAASTLGVIFDQPFAAEKLKGGASDKSVSPHELVPFLESQGLKAVYRVGGTSKLMEEFVSRDIPVIVEQWLLKRDNGELVGHYRVMRGYDQTARTFTTNDSFNGPNFVIPYSQFDEWWRAFNRTYIVVYKPEQEAVVREVLGADWDRQANAEGAVAMAKQETATKGDGYSYFNLGSSYTMLRQYSQAKAAYDQAFTHTFPEHFLWYEYGPLEAYYQTGEYDRVLKLTEELLAQAGQVEEALYYRSLVFEKQGKTSEAQDARVKMSVANPRFTPPFK